MRPRLEREFVPVFFSNTFIWKLIFVTLGKSGEIDYRVGDELMKI